MDQIKPFVQLGAHVSIGRGLAVIAGASDRDVVTQSMEADEFCIDDHVRMVADARRYRWLRDGNRAIDIDEDLAVAAGNAVYFGNDLDRNIDDAMRLARLQELHPCAD